MNTFFNDFHKSAKDIRLTHAERHHIQTGVLAAIYENEKAVPSPYFRLPIFRYAVGFAVILIVVTGGTAYAAEGALPGDLLYSVKVSVNEPIELALATSPEAKAKENATIAKRRLAEAEELASENRLTASTSDELAANFNEHASAAYAAAENTGNAGIATQFSADFGSDVATQGTAILTAGEKTKNVNAIRASANLVTTIATQAEDEGAPATTSETATVVPATTGRADTAHAALTALESAVSSADLPGSAETIIEARIASIQNLLLKADAETSIGSTTQANRDYANVISNVNAIQSALRAGKFSKAAPTTNIRAGN